MSRELWFEHESASLVLTIHDDTCAMISGLYSNNKRQGHATALMNEIIRFADKRGLALMLHVGMYGPEPGMDNDQLIVFYEKFGFVALNDDEYVLMERMPE